MWFFDKINANRESIQSLSNEVGVLYSKVYSLEDALKDARQERDEFKELLFKQFGLRNIESSVATQQKPVAKILNWRSEKSRLENASREAALKQQNSIEKHWEEKAEEAEKEVGDLTDGQV
jgi:hypothetical protein